jgi:hypothetical protein
MLAQASAARQLHFGRRRGFCADNKKPALGGLFGFQVILTPPEIN